MGIRDKQRAIRAAIRIVEGLARKCEDAERLRFYEWLIGELGSIGGAL